MADDTRQPDDQTSSPRPRGPANTMPGGMAHTAGGKAAEAEKELTYFDVVRQLGPEYYLTFYKRPCVRDGQLTGIGAGFVAGSFAAILGRPVQPSTNVAVITWAVTSCAAYQYCQYQRSKEKAGMNMARDLMEKKRATIEAKREARRKAREERERLEMIQQEEERRRKSWGYWFEKNVRFW